MPAETGDFATFIFVNRWMNMAKLPVKPESYNLAAANSDLVTHIRPLRKLRECVCRLETSGFTKSSESLKRETWNQLYFDRFQCFWNLFLEKEPKRVTGIRRRVQDGTSSWILLLHTVNHAQHKVENTQQLTFSVCHNRECA